MLDDSKETFLKVNPHGIKYMIMSHQNAGKNRNIELSNKSLNKCDTVEVFGLGVVNLFHFARHGPVTNCSKCNEFLVP